MVFALLTVMKFKSSHPFHVHNAWGYFYYIPDIECITQIPILITMAIPRTSVSACMHMLDSTAVYTYTCSYMYTQNSVFSVKKNSVLAHGAASVKKNS